MENIFEIKFSFEQNVKDNVILKFSNKQGGAYNVFSYHWQCFVWAAVVGFIHNERRPLDTVTKSVSDLEKKRVYRFFSFVKTKQTKTKKE